FIDAIAAGCTINEKSGQAYSCKAKEGSNMRDWTRKEEPGDLYETLADIALKDGGKKEAAAIAQMHNLWSTKGDDWKRKNATKAATARLFKYLKDHTDSPDPKMSKIAIFSTHMGMINGLQKQLFPMIEALKNTQARNQAYANYMTFGRLTGFEELKRITSKSKDADVIQAALQAPRNMYKDTDKEKAAYCPWAEAYMGNTDLKIASKAGYVMVKCKGKYIDTLIDEGEKRVKAGEFKPPLSAVYREPCFQFMRGVTDKAAREKQCERLYGFLQGVADNASIDSKVRGLSLWNIYYQRRDQKTLDLMRKYENHKDPEVKKRAGEAIKSLTTTYKLK
ncbi:MAG: hypothetical protein AAFS10_14805, partial [Myxococcota bacterium]